MKNNRKGDYIQTTKINIYNFHQLLHSIDAMHRFIFTVTLQSQLALFDEFND